MFPKTCGSATSTSLTTRDTRPRRSRTLPSWRHRADVQARGSAAGLRRRRPATPVSARRCFQRVIHGRLTPTLRSISARVIRPEGSSRLAASRRSICACASWAGCHAKTAPYPSRMHARASSPSLKGIRASLTLRASRQAGQRRRASAISLSELVCENAEDRRQGVMYRQWATPAPQADPRPPATVRAAPAG
jgi:hypothetical protein